MQGIQIFVAACDRGHRVSGHPVHAHHPTFALLYLLYDLLLELEVRLLVELHLFLQLLA